MLFCMTASVYGAMKIQNQYQGVPDGPILTNIQTSINKLTQSYDIKTKDYLTGYTDRAIRLIHTATQPFGYFDTTATHTFKINPELTTVTYHISLGQPILINQLNITLDGPGKNEPRFTHLLTNSPLQQGEILNTDEYNTLKRNLSNTAASLGYFNSEIEKSQILINREAHTADITIKMNTHTRAKFGTTTFSKNSLDPTFIKKFLAYREGENYDAKKIQKTQRDLINSGYFQRVLVTPQTNQKGIENIPVNILLIPATNQQYSIGGGYGTDTSIRGTLGVNIRQVNSYGHKFSSQLQASPYNSSLTLNYQIPKPDPTRNMITLSSGIGEINEINSDDNHSKVAKVSATYTTTYDKWIQNTSLIALYEDYELSDIQSKAELIYPDLEWKYLNSNKDLNPDKGVSLNINLMGTPRFLAYSSQPNPANFVQARLDARFLHTFDLTQTRLLLRGSVAKTLISDISNLPLSLQLFAGGAQSIRGYSYNSIGETNLGTDLIVYSSELQQKIFGNWYLGAFYDAGTVADTIAIPQDLYSSAGPALAWLSPIGMLELSLAYQLQNPNSTHAKVVTFSMGTYL